jgi:flagellar biogenesis protein FliO
VVLAVLALLSPLLIPAAFFLGIIWLVKKLSHPQARPPLAA